MQDLLEKIETFCDETNMGRAEFGRQAIGNPNLWRRLRQGKGITLRNAVRVQDFIKANAKKSGETNDAA